LLTAVPTGAARGASVMTDEPMPPDLDVDIPMPSGLKVTTEQPYHMLVVADFGGSENGTVSGPLKDGVVNLTADNFDEVMSSACPSVNFTTTDPLASGNAMVEVDLRFNDFKALQPENLVQNFAMTRSLAELREQLVSRMLGKLSSEQLDAAVAKAVGADGGLSWLAESIKWTPSKAAPDPGAVDSLMGQIDLGDDSGDSDEPPAKSPLGQLVSAAAQDGSSISHEEAAAIRRTLKEVDRRLSAWLTAILHAPQVQAIESTWRSLAFLVSQIDFRKHIRLSILHAGGDMLESFRSRVIDPVFDEGAMAPDLIIVDREFNNNAADLEALDEFAQHAASLPAVALANVGAGFFGVRYSWQVKTLPPIVNLFDQWQFAKWKTLRKESYARSLGAVFGRCLLRPPHGREEVKDFKFNYHEEAIADKDLCWANGVIAVAAAVARSAADIGWPSAMAGMVHGRVEGFSTAVGGKKGDKQFGPADTDLAQEKIEELAMAGLNATVGIRDHDDVLVWNGLTAAFPQRNHPEAFLEISLPYQLFAARISALFFLLKEHLSGLSPDAVAPFVKKHVCDWMGYQGEPDAEQLSVQTRAPDDAPNALELAVTVTPPQNILPGAIPVVMGYRLG
jgi:type VI secretion system protein ImpC